MAENNSSYDGGTFKTINCDYVWIDMSGDSTVRPIRPSLLEQAKDARELAYGSREPGPVPPEVLAKLMADLRRPPNDVFISSDVNPPPKDSDKTGHG